MGKALKVAYLAFSEDFGGAHAGFTHAYNITKSLSNYCNLVNVFFSCNKVDILRKEGNVSYYGVCFPSSKRFFNILKFIRSYFFVRRMVSKVDLLHERFHINPIDLLFLYNKPYILEINDPAMVLHDNRIYRYLIGLKLKRCNSIITQTETLKKILSKYTNKKIYVVANGVDTNFFKPNLKNNIRRFYNLGEEEVLVIYVGAFMKWHGVQDVVKLAGNFPHVKFLMVGLGSEFNKVKSESKKLSNLIMVGDVVKEDIPKFLSAADIAIAPFDTKNFSKLDIYGFWWCPMKLFEYMACGKPVVTYDFPEVRKIVKEGGLLAKQGDFGDFCNKLNKLIVDKNLRLKLGQRARKISLRCDWKYRAGEIYEVYQRCLKN